MAVLNNTPDLSGCNACAAQNMCNCGCSLDFPGDRVSACPKPHPCDMPQAKKQKLHCNLRKVALQMLNCNIRLSAVRTSFSPKTALQQTKNCIATSIKLRCGEVALSCRFPADFRFPRWAMNIARKSWETSRENFPKP